MLPRGSGKSFRAKGRVVFFATNNVNKFNEARRVLGEWDIAVGMLRVKSFEVQSERLDEIAKASVIDAFRRCHLPVVVEDAGLFVNALNGFPGPYAAYVYKTVGNRGLLRLMRDFKDRRACFESVVAYLSAGLESPICFEGEVCGEITTEEKVGGGGSGFGFDPVFRPKGGGRSFAEMSIVEKNAYSHRGRAFRRFAEWYKR